MLSTTVFLLSVCKIRFTQWNVSETVETSFLSHRHGHGVGSSDEESHGNQSIVAQPVQQAGVSLQNLGSSQTVAETTDSVCLLQPVASPTANAQLTHPSPVPPQRTHPYTRVTYETASVVLARPDSADSGASSSFWIGKIVEVIAV